MSKKKDVLALKSRQMIFQTVLKYPGLHFRELIRKLGMSEGTVRYHLIYLKKRNLIIERQDGGYLRFFVNDAVGNGDKDLMAILRNKVQRYILFNIMFNMAASCTKLSQDLELSTEVVRYHLQKLIDTGLIMRGIVEDGYVHVKYDKPRAKQYFSNTSEVIFVLADYNRLNDFLITNKKWFKDVITSDLIDFSIELEKKNSHRRKIGAFDKELDNTIDALFELFPLPYYF